ncbi:MAG: hypothetical protein KME55_41425 [Nostoc indistinguendum CM1-VF10]|jgi:hypothetical protein|nr:hypothetical protein [Nostoc indistinguendum CM1-VF10]
MLSKIVEGMLSHREQLKIHSIHQKFLRCAVFSKNRSSQEMGNIFIKELLSTLTIDERCGVMLEFEDVKMTNLLNWWQMPHSGVNGWREKVG